MAPLLQIHSPSVNHNTTFKQHDKELISGKTHLSEEMHVTVTYFIELTGK
jgi:hypothetical protein